MNALGFEERIQLDVRVHYFGWSLDTIEKSRERLIRLRILGYSWSEESHRFLDALDNEGRLQVPSYDP